MSERDSDLTKRFREERFNKGIEWMASAISGETSGGTKLDELDTELLFEVGFNFAITTLQQEHKDRRNSEGAE